MESWVNFKGTFKAKENFSPTKAKVIDNLAISKSTNDVIQARTFMLPQWIKCEKIKLQKFFIQLKFETRTESESQTK